MGAFCLLLIGCVAPSPQTQTAGTAAGVAFQLATARVTNFKGAGLTRSYDVSLEDAWVGILELTAVQKTSDKSKIVAKNAKQGWIMTERKMGLLEAAHDIYFIDRVTESKVAIEVVSKTSPKVPIDSQRQMAIQNSLAEILSRSR